MKKPCESFVLSGPDLPDALIIPRSAPQNILLWVLLITSAISFFPDCLLVRRDLSWLRAPKSNTLSCQNKDLPQIFQIFFFCSETPRKFWLTSHRSFSSALYMGKYRTGVKGKVTLWQAMNWRASSGDSTKLNWSLWFASYLRCTFQGPNSSLEFIQIMRLGRT